VDSAPEEEVDLVTRVCEDIHARLPGVDVYRHLTRRLTANLDGRGGHTLPWQVAQECCDNASAEHGADYDPCASRASVYRQLFPRNVHVCHNYQGHAAVAMKVFLPANPDCDDASFEAFACAFVHECVAHARAAEVLGGGVPRLLGLWCVGIHWRRWPAFVLVTEWVDGLVPIGRLLAISPNVYSYSPPMCSETRRRLLRNARRMLCALTAAGIRHNDLQRGDNMFFQRAAPHRLWLLDFGEATTGEQRGHGGGHPRDCECHALGLCS
jgi:hypothetical protein